MFLWNKCENTQQICSHHYYSSRLAYFIMSSLSWKFISIKCVYVLYAYFMYYMYFVSALSLQLCKKMQLFSTKYKLNTAYLVLSM